MNIGKIGKKISWLIIFSALVLIAYSPTLKNGFVNLDEDKYLLENVSIRDFSPSAIVHLFDPHINGTYIPLTMLTYSAEYHFFKLNPLVYHIDNLALHLFNSLLVLWLVFIITSKFDVSLLTAAMFAFSPLRVESVAWVMERKDLLYSFLYLGALICYVWFIKSRLTGYLWGAMLLFIFSLFSKPQAITFLLIMPVFDQYFKRPWNKGLFVEKLPFCLISLAFLAVGLMGEEHFSKHQDLKIWFAGYTMILYFFKSFIPFQLSLINPVPQYTNIFLSWEFYISIFSLFGAGYFLVFWHAKSRETLFAFLFYVLLMALPIINMRYGDGLFYGHYTYLASVGLYFLFAVKYSQWYGQMHSKILKQVTILLLAGYLLVFAWMSFERCSIWESPMTLWTDVIQHIPKAGRADPVFALAYNNQGNCYKQLGYTLKAIEDYNKAIEINPNYEGAYYNRALIYLKQGKMAQVSVVYNKP